MEQGNSLNLDFIKKTQEDLPAFEKKSPRSRMFVRAMIWERKSHGLFDYESKDITQSQFGFKQSGILYRDNAHVQFKDHCDSINDADEEEDDPKVLAYTRQVSDTEYLIQPRNDVQPLNNRIWLIVRSLKRNGVEEGYAVQPNDVIKIGRVVLRVTELNTEFHYGSEDIDEEFDDVVKLEVEPDNEDAGKFCWTNEETPDNPKMGPCKCTGSMRYIHFQCLKHWIDSRKQAKDEVGVHSILWKNFDGEIGKTAYPYIFEYKGKRWNLHTPYRPNDNFKTPYIVLESLKNDRNSTRVVHTLTATNEKSVYKLGRGHEADVRVINDISVSRGHMQLAYKNGNFILSDSQSKFGTLVLVKNDLSITENDQKAVQVGRTVMSFEIRSDVLLPDENPFQDVGASKYFENCYKVPNFGFKEEEISENVNVPNQDHIQNPVPHFLVHENHPAIRGRLLPRNQYMVDPHNLNH